MREDIEEVIVNEFEGLSRHLSVGSVSRILETIHIRCRTASH